MTHFFPSSTLTTSINNLNINRTSNVSGTNRNQTNNSISSTNNEEDQLNRINLQALQNRDPYISKIVDQAQRVCVYKFIAEKREWERKELEGTLFVYERLCEPDHGFVILSTVSRDTFVQIIKPFMEFKHTPAHEAFLQYKVDVGDIYGIWFISKNDCPRVTECLQNLTLKAREKEQMKIGRSSALTLSTNDKDILSLLTDAQKKFQESKTRSDSDTTDQPTSMPPLLKRLFSNTDNSNRSTLDKQAVSVADLEKQFLQPLTSSNMTELQSNTEQTVTSSNFVSTKKTENSVSNSQVETTKMTTARLMTPSDFRRQPTAQVPVQPIPIVPLMPSNRMSTISTALNMNSFSREDLRYLLIDMIQNDSEFVTGLYNAYCDRHYLRYQIDS